MIDIEAHIPDCTCTRCKSISLRQFSLLAEAIHTMGTNHVLYTNECGETLALIWLYHALEYFRTKHPDQSNATFEDAVKLCTRLSAMIEQSNEERLH